MTENAEREKKRREQVIAMQNKPKRKAFYVWLLATLACMVMIFAFSAMDGESSKEVSDGTLYRILMLFGAFLPQRFILWFTIWIRKVAHFVAYMMLGFSATGMWQTEKQEKRGALYGQLTASLYACTDEIHQLFVPGRAGMITDVLLDSCGALTGVILASGLRYLVCFFRRQKK